jgi:hypothetical protein
MTVGADLDLQIVAERRTRGERIAAGASYRHVLIFRMNRGFHGLLTGVGDAKGGASLAAHPALLKRRDAHMSGGFISVRGLRISWVPLSTEAVDKSVDFCVFQGAISGQNCIFITLANY